MMAMTPEQTAFAWNQRRLLLLNLLSAWRRRGADLLQVGLGGGLSPDVFWEAGFDVSALDGSSVLIEQWREATGPKVEYHLGKPDYLPFDDGSFDHVVLTHLGLDASLPLAEAVRVARRGVVVLEWNRLSLHGAALAREGGGGRAAWPWALAGLGRHVCPDCRQCLRSMLPLPRRWWLAGKEGGWTRKQMRRVHDAVLHPAIGAILGLRLEKSPMVMTPVGAVLEQARTHIYGGVTAGVSSVESLRRAPGKEEDFS